MSCLPRRINSWCWMRGVSWPRVAASSAAREGCRDARRSGIWLPETSEIGVRLSSRQAGWRAIPLRERDRQRAVRAGLAWEARQLDSGGFGCRGDASPEGEVVISAVGCATHTRWRRGRARDRSRYPGGRVADDPWPERRGEEHAGQMLVVAETQAGELTLFGKDAADGD